MLPAPHRMRAGTDFEAAVRRGRRAGAGASSSTPRPRRSLDGPRVGFVVSKAVGGAVVRNRVARRLRATVRPHLSSIPADRLVVLRAQPASATATFAELEADVSRLLSPGSASSGPRCAGGPA